MSSASDHDAAELAARQLAQADGAQARGLEVLTYLLDDPDRALFSDAVVAQVRNMIADLAYQLLYARAEAVGTADCAAQAELQTPVLAGTLKSCDALVAHCLELALEHQLCEATARNGGLDPVLPPELQSLVADDDPEVGATAMQVLAAQARFVQAQRRMELGLADLPADLLHTVLHLWRSNDPDGNTDTLRLTEEGLRARYDEGATRLSLHTRLLSIIGRRKRTALLSLDQAGPSLFSSALALAIGSSRFQIVSAAAANPLRLSLALRAAEQDREVIGATLVTLGSAPGALTVAVQLLPDVAHSLLRASGRAP